GGSVGSHRDNASATGMLLIDEETLNNAVTRFDKEGLTVKFHAAGDGAVRASLEAVQATRENNGFSTLLHNIGHNTFVHPDDIRAARKIGATFEVSPYLWAPSAINNA